MALGTAVARCVSSHPQEYGFDFSFSPGCARDADDKVSVQERRRRRLAREKVDDHVKPSPAANIGLETPTLPDDAELEIKKKTRRARGGII